jgi:hypothetical protein
VEVSLAEYEAVLEKISKIEGLVRKHFEFSEDETTALLKKKETAKTIARDHQARKHEIAFLNLYLMAYSYIVAL